MNDLQVFNNEQFGEIRCIDVENQPWFCLNDLCRALEISNVGNVKSRLIADGIRTMDAVDSLGRPSSMIFVNEPNMYKTVFQSRKKEAEAFTDWVTTDILPSIRKSGTYSLPAVTPNIMALSGFASTVNTLRRIMRDEGCTAAEIAQMAEGLCKQFGIHIPENFVKEIPGQLTLFGREQLTIGGNV